VLIAEELVLTALDPVRGRPVNGSGGVLPVCLTGALVAELALSGAVTWGGRRFEAAGAPPADPLLRDVHAALPDVGGRRAADQLRRLDKAVGRVWSRVVDGLVDQGVLGRDPRGPLQVTAHRVLQPALRAQVVERLRAAAAGSGPLDARTAALLSLTGPARLLEVVSDRPHAHAKRRIAEATELTPVAEVVKKVLAEAVAAAAVGATVATTAASSG
jgi:hypothetical protein